MGSLVNPAIQASQTPTSQTTSSAVALTSSSPITTVYTGTAAITQPLPTVGLIDGQEHSLKNLFSATVNLTVTGNIDNVAGASSVQAKGVQVTYKYIASIPTWIKL